MAELTAHFGVEYTDTLLQAKRASGPADPATGVTGKEDPASGQAETTSGPPPTTFPTTPPLGLPASEEGGDVIVTADRLIKHMVSDECQQVEDILETFRDQEARKDIASYQAYNGMSPLHHAARMLKVEWVRELTEWAPDMANSTTYLGSTPVSWTPLQCAVDQDVPEKGPLWDNVAAIMEMLIKAMDKQAILHKTGAMQGKQGTSGGKNVLHALASRSRTVAWWNLAELIEKKWDRNTLLDLINMPSADGRSVIDFALSTKGDFAKTIKQHFSGAVHLLEQAPSREKKTKTRICVCGLCPGFWSCGLCPWLGRCP